MESFLESKANKLFIVASFFLTARERAKKHVPNRDLHTSKLGTEYWLLSYFLMTPAAN
jgi:hypothetical protein